MTGANVQVSSSTGQPVRGRVGSLVFVFGTLLATLPVWLTPYPEMVDLPEHAAQIAMLRTLYHPAFPYSSLFDVHWFTPYWAGYGLIYALVPVVGIVVACKLVVSLAVAALPMVTALVMRETGADPYWAWLSLPVMYGYSYQWGLLNFIVAAPLGLLFFWVFVRHVRQPTWTSALGIAVLVNLLFFCHALICMFFGLVAVCYGLVDKPLKLAVHRILPLAAVLPFASLWIAHTLAVPASPTAAVTWDLGWRHLDSRVLGMCTRMFGLKPRAAAILIGIGVFAVPLLSGNRFARRRALWVPLVVSLAIQLVGPCTVLGTAFVYQRFAGFVVPLFLIALYGSPKAALRPGWHRVMPAVVILWFALVGARTLAYDRHAQGFTEVVQRMIPGQRALSLIFDRKDGLALAPTFLHYPLWYAAEKHGLVEPNFAMVPYPNPVTYCPRRMNGSLGELCWHPEEFNWNKNKGENYRYFVVRSSLDLGQTLFASATCRVELVHHRDTWWLYEQDENCIRRPSRAAQ